MKIYNKSIVNAIQTEINKGNIKLETFKEYDDFLSVINSANIIIRCYYDEKIGRRDGMLILHNYEINADYLNNWRTSAPGTFIIKDYKKDNKDFIGNTLYHELFCNINGQDVSVLIRILNEITNNISDQQKNELIDKFGDITIDNKYFSIIKVRNINDTWNTYDFYMNKDIVINERIETNGSITEEALINNDAEPVDDSTNSEPLF